MEGHFRPSKAVSNAGQSVPSKPGTRPDHRGGRSDPSHYIPARPAFHFSFLFSLFIHNSSLKNSWLLTNIDNGHSRFAFLAH